MTDFCILMAVGRPGGEYKLAVNPNNVTAVRPSPDSKEDSEVFFLDGRSVKVKGTVDSIVMELCHVATYRIRGKDGQS